MEEQTAEPPEPVLLPYLKKRNIINTLQNFIRQSCKSAAFIALEGLLEILHSLVAFLWHMRDQLGRVMWYQDTWCCSIRQHGGVEDMLGK